MTTPTQATDLISLDEVKQHLKISGSSEDDLVTGYLEGAVGALDGPEGWLGRTIIPRALVMRLDRLSSGGPVHLLYPPVLSVEAISVRYSAGEWIGIPDEIWELDGDTVELEPGRNWPPCPFTSRGYRIDYTAGYEELPKAMRAAILLMVGDLYENRQTESALQRYEVPMSTTVAALLNPFRTFHC